MAPNTFDQNIYLNTDRKNIPESRNNKWKKIREFGICLLISSAAFISQQYKTNSTTNNQINTFQRDYVRIQPPQTSNLYTLKNEMQIQTSYQTKKDNKPQLSNTQTLDDLAMR